MTRKSTLGIIAVVMLLLIGGILYHTAASKMTISPAKGDGAVIADAFRTTGAKFEKMNLQGWAQLNNRYSTETEMTALLAKAAAELGLDNQKLTTKKQQEASLLSLTRSGWMDRHTYITVIVQTMRDNGTHKKGETYIIVGISHFVSPENYNFLRNKIVKVFSQTDVQGHFSTIIAGKVAGKIEVFEMQKMAKKVMKKVGAGITDNYADGRMVSVAGFTPAIADRLTLGAKSVNINMAARYDSVDKTTYIYIGTPIITTEY